jgi:hypothetical protein
MNDDFMGILLLGLIVNLVIIILFYSVLSSINKNQKRTTYLLKLLYEKDGTKLTNEELSKLNRV